MCVHHVGPIAITVAVRQYVQYATKDMWPIKEYVSSVFLIVSIVQLLLHAVYAVKDTSLMLKISAQRVIKTVEHVQWLPITALHVCLDST